MDLISLCRACEGGMGAPIWPDGGALLDQPLKLRRAFNVIRTLALHYEKAK